MFLFDQFIDLFLIICSRMWSVLNKKKECWLAEWNGMEWNTVKKNGESNNDD